MAIRESQVLNLDAPGASSAKPYQPSNRGHVLFAIIVFIAGAIFLAQSISWKQAAMYLVAGVLGVTLYHARYGFTTSFRAFILERRGAAIRAQMIMFLFVNLLFLPILLKGHILGHPVAGYVSPIGISLIVGAFLFGIGMQLGDGCASGTLYHIGGGDVRGILTIVGFLFGSVLASWNFTWWTNTPHLQPVSLIQSFGPIGGFAIEIVLLIGVFVGSYIWERKHNGDVEPLITKNQSMGWSVIFKGPWSWITGGVVLAVGNTLLLVLSGKPWGVTFAFTLWGSKIAQAIGIPVEHWGYWQQKANSLALHQSIFHDVTTVTDIGVMLGALLAAGLAGKFPKPYIRRFPARMLWGIFIGGVMMGYGARLAFGCNIGSYFSGIASFSVHGWVWFVCAMLGSVIGVKIRPVCALSNQIRKKTR
jgi:uncharacterized membrane protein YedE/YeeE